MPPLPSHESTRSVAPPPLQDPSTQNPATPPQSDAAADRAALAHGTEASVTAKLEEGAPAATAAVSLSPLAPLSVPVFRMLWLTWVAANTCMWMNDVASAWLMTTLTSKPIWVALVQTAATLPVFLLGLPSGALADILDRKRFLFFTQVWVAVVGIVFGIVFGKAVFGGFGRNIFNPALVGRCFIYIAFPHYMTMSWAQPFLSLPGGFAAWTVAARPSDAQKAAEEKPRLGRSWWSRPGATDAGWHLVQVVQEFACQSGQLFRLGDLDWSE
mgnify:CR=1 FL=1